jgi:hypothetical protein
MSKLKSILKLSSEKLKKIPKKFDLIIIINIKIDW